MEWVRQRHWFPFPVPGGRRARLLLAALVAVGTAVPLILAAPGGPGTSFLKVAAPVEDHVTTTTTTTTTLLPSVKPATTTTTTTVAGRTPTPTTLPPATNQLGDTRPTVAGPRTTAVTQPAPPPPPSSIPAVSSCTASQVGLSVATNRAGYQPGDTMEINVAAVNRSSNPCILEDPPRTDPPDGTCQPETLVEAPGSASVPDVQQVVADIGPACNGSQHYLLPGDAWHTAMTVTIPSDGSWGPGGYTVHSEWQSSGVLVSADTSFDLGGTTTTTTPPTTTPPTTDPTTTTVPA